MNSLLNIGVIGLGVGSHYLGVCKNHPNVHLKTVCDFNSNKLELAKTQYPDIIITNNANEVLADKDIGLVAIASYDNFHHEQTLEAIKNKKHVFVEKPLCLNINHAKEISEALKKNQNLKLSSNMPLRTCPRFIKLREQIQSGEMGEVYFIEADYLWGRTSKLINGWRPEMDFYSIVYGAAVHMIDLALWLTGKLPVEVIGMGNQIATAGSDYKYRDFTVNLFKFADGSIFKVTAHGGCTHPHFHGVKVFGTKKMFSQDFANSYWIDSLNEDQHIKRDEYEYPAKEKRSGVLKSFLDSIIRPEVKPIVEQVEVFNTMSVCFAAESALDKNESVKIEYIN